MSVFGKRQIRNIGGFPLSVFGSLLQEEEDWFEEQEFARMDRAIPVLELAVKISKDKDIPAEEAMKLIEGFSNAGGGNIALLANYTEDLKTLTEASKIEKRFPTRIATLALQSRVSEEWLESHAADLLESFDIAFRGVWMPQDTSKLPVSIINELALFMIGERRGEVIADEEAKTLGESSTDSMKHDPPLEPTGKKSTAKSKAAA